ncbi:MAG: hypothetical protein J7L69_10880 [Desulfobulbaceae bacterium]|nr:hypothetical protein [Desulfobulbaceae bacterium]
MMTSSPQKKKGKKQPVASLFIFLAVVAALYGLAFLLAPERSIHALHFGLKMLSRLAPILMLVCLLMFLLNLFIKPDWIQKHVGHDSGLKGFLIAIVSGIISMGPIYAWYGMLKDFHKKGMRPALVAAFLYSRSVKLPLLPLMVYYFGTVYTLVLSFYLVLFSAANGLLTEWLASGKKAEIARRID